MLRRRSHTEGSRRKMRGGNESRRRASQPARHGHAYTPQVFHVAPPSCSSPASRPRHANSQLWDTTRTPTAIHSHATCHGHVQPCLSYMSPCHACQIHHTRQAHHAHTAYAMPRCAPTHCHKAFHLSQGWLPHKGHVHMKLPGWLASLPAWLPLCVTTSHACLLLRVGKEREDPKPDKGRLLCFCFLFLPSFLPFPPKWSI